MSRTSFSTVSKAMAGGRRSRHDDYLTRNDARLGQLNNNVPLPTPTSDTTVIQLFKIVSLLSAVAQEVGMSNDEITAALENRDE